MRCVRKLSVPQTDCGTTQQLSTFRLSMFQLRLSTIVEMESIPWSAVAQLPLWTPFTYFPLLSLPKTKRKKTSLNSKPQAKVLKLQTCGLYGI